MIKHLIILFLISKCLAQLSTDIRHQNLKFNSIDIWKNENKRIKNSELKKELIKLSEKFRNKREHIKNDFNEKVNPQKIKKTMIFQTLKKYI